ncbi:MAG: hypothetical protein R6W90_13110 [Ignavibacteriaceae bacterium]
MKKIILFLFAIVTYYGCESSIVDDPATIIKYSIPERSYVKVVVENSYNTVIATLVDGVTQAGVFSANFDVSNLAEGIYFYTIEVKGMETDYYYKTTKYMILVK